MTRKSLLETEAFIRRALSHFPDEKPSDKAIQAAAQKLLANEKEPD